MISSLLHKTCGAAVQTTAGSRRFPGSNSERFAMVPKTSRFSLEAFSSFYRNERFDRGVYFYHAHTYFPLTTAGVAFAESFKKTWHDEFKAGGDVLFGKTQDYLTGPHTRGNFETAFTRDSYGDVLMWLQQHRPQELSILIHPLTVRAVADHTDNALWMGPPVAFNMAILERAQEAGLKELAAGKSEAAYIWEAACMLNESVAEAAAATA